MLIGALAGCASTPPPTKAELLANGEARVVVEDPVQWALSAPPPLGMRIEITAVDGKNACYGNRCPTEVTAPAGKVKLAVLCLTVVRDLHLPQGRGEVEGELAAGRFYALHPLSVVPDCRLSLHEADLP